MVCTKQHFSQFFLLEINFGMLGPKNVEQSRITFSMEKNGLICNSLKLNHKFCMKLETKSFTVINANITKKKQHWQQKQGWIYGCRSRVWVSRGSDEKD